MSREREASVIVRWVVAAAAAALAALAVQHWLVAHAERRAVIQLLADTGLSTRQPEAARAAAGDPDPVRGKLAIARALLAEAFDYRPFAKLPPREAAEAAASVNQRLELAREIAAAALAVRPGAWQASMILGGTTYRLWSSRGDPRTFSNRAAWEGPLLAATRLAPGEDEPFRFLAVAWLEVWPTLTPGEKNGALPTLRRAFQDPETFARCAQLWLSATPDRGEAFALVPDESRAWSVLEGIYAGGAQWDELCAARRQRDQALEAELQRRIGEAGEHLRGGDPSGARSLAASVVSEAPVGLRFRDAVEAALAVCPPGPLSSQEPVRRWLAWAVEGFVRGQARLPPGAVARLVASAGVLPPHDEALAALAAGDLVEAERLERRNAAPATEAWAPYWLAKAWVLAGQHRSSEAAAAVARVHRSWRTSVPLVEARLVVARATGGAAGVAAAQAELTSLASASWAATDWRWHGPVARLDLLADADAPGLGVGLDVVPPAGAVVQVSLDGAATAVAPAKGEAMLRLTTRIARGPHLLEFETIAGGRVVPGKVELITGER